MRALTSLALLLLACSFGCQEPASTQVTPPEQTTVAPKAPTTTQAAKTQVTPPPTGTSDPKKVVAPKPNSGQGKGPQLPPSRFRLSTLRAPELQVHETPEPPSSRRIQKIGPSTNADLKAIATGIEAPKPSVPPGSPPVERIDDKRIRVGRIVVDREKNHVEIDGSVNMTEGILEYYAVGPSGKVHESVLTYSGLASQAHLGLLLLGLEPRRRGGPKVKLFIQWTDPKTGKKKQVSASEWLKDRSTGKVAKDLIWRFHGSGFFKGRYAGDTAHTLIGLVGDPNVVIALDANSGNPYQGANQGFEVMTTVIPAKGTAVTLLIQADK